MKGKKVFCSLTKRSDFSKVFELGSKFPSKYFIVYALPNRLLFCRIGFSVSRKVGNAVVRNRIRRRLREILRRQLTDSSLHCDFVVVARSASVEAEFGQMQASMTKIFSRLDNEDTVNSNN